MKQDAFSTYNPIINFVFYIGAVVFGMFFVHPAFLVVSGTLAMAYYVTVKGIDAWKMAAVLVPVFVVVSIINPLINTLGERVLFTWAGGRPYTFEALCYGMAIGGMLVTILLWFASYNLVMTGDKFLYIFGRIAPSISMVLTMVLRFVPGFQRKISQIAGARKCVGKAGDTGTRRDKIDNGLTIVSTLTTWALEGGIMTADSMQSRGYGTGRRTTFSIYRFAIRDKALLAAEILLAGIIGFCGVKGAAEAAYTPEIVLANPANTWTMLGLTAYALFLAIPTVLNIMEEITWRILRSRI